MNHTIVERLNDVMLLTHEVSIKLNPSRVLPLYCLHEHTQSHL